jgi:hypothetical protein
MSAEPKIVITRAKNGFYLKLDGETYVFETLDGIYEFLKEEFDIKDADEELE